MEATKKARIYNVIILDKSGSMTSIARQAIDGVNETLGGIRSSQLRDPEQDNLVTLVAFCGCEMRVIFKNAPIAEVRDITQEDYIPCCTTPLYDAVGTTITKLRRGTDGKRCAVAVTIITDGYENASRQFSGPAVKKLIDDCRERGWMFAYIGADHDVEAVAQQLSIDNVMEFDKSAKGTSQMFNKERRAKERWLSKMTGMLSDMDIDDDELVSYMKRNNEDYFSSL